jgi:hypothetical protein
LPDGFKPEGIVTANKHTAYVSSGFYGSIYEIDLATGDGSILVDPAPGRSLLGLAYDVRSDLIFAAGGVMGNMFVFDAKTGQLVRQYQLGDPMIPGQNPTSLVNDIVVTKKAIYCTDSFRPLLYKITLGPAGRLPEDMSFDVIPLTGDFAMTMDAPLGFPINANGIDASPNGKELVIVNTSSGLLYHVDALTGYSTEIDIGGASMLFGDGIMLEPTDDGYTLYVARNVPNMIAKVHLDGDLNSGFLVKNITSPLLRIPSSVDDFGDRLYVVNANFIDSPPLIETPTVPFNIIHVNK